jgi:hypothetical protein
MVNPLTRHSNHSTAQNNQHRITENPLHAYRWATQQYAPDDTWQKMTCSAEESREKRGERGMLSSLRIQKLI